MQFKVSGKHQGSMRRRTRVYVARSEATARQRAAADGINVETVELLPPEPVTGEQRSLAVSLQVLLPEGIDKQGADDFLARVQAKDKPASPSLLAIASEFGLDLTEHVGKRRLFTRLFSMLSEPGREAQLAAWFAYRVYRELVKGRADAAIKSPFDPRMQSIAERMLLVDGVLGSIRRYTGEDLVWFGQWTGQTGAVHVGGSNRTKAYKEAIDLLRPLVSAEARAGQLARQQAVEARPVVPDAPPTFVSAPTKVVAATATAAPKRRSRAKEITAGAIVLALLAWALFA